MKKNYKPVFIVFICLLIILLISFWYQHSKVETFDASYTTTNDMNYDVNTSSPSTDYGNAPPDFGSASNGVDDINTLSNTYNAQLSQQSSGELNTDINIVPENLSGITFNPTMYQAAANNTATTRPCAVYYVNDPDNAVNDTLHTLCDSGFFDNPPVAMKVRQNVLEAKQSARTITPAEITELTYIINYYNKLKPKLPNGTCKVDFSVNGWIEPTKDNASGQIYPKKDAGSSATNQRGEPGDWAYCFKEISTIGSDNVKTTALNTSKKFANDKAILSSDSTSQPFSDNNSYARVSFNTLTLYDFITDAQKINSKPDSSYLNNAICAAGTLAPAGGLPADGSFLCVQLDETNKIRQFNPVIYDMPSQSIQRIVDQTSLNNIYKQLFTTQLQGNTLFLVPERFSAIIYSLQTDICINPANKNNVLSNSGRVVKVTKTTSFPLSFVQNIGLTAQVLYTSMGPNDVTYGDLTTLNQRLIQLKAQLATAQAKLNADPVPPTNITFNAGLKRKNYTLTSPSWGGNNSADMNSILANTNLCRFVNEEIVSIPASYNWEQHYGKVYNGYIKVPESGSYIFMINSDDGGEVMINDQIVATHYGGHWVDYGGSGNLARNPVPTTLNAGEYYPIRIRHFQWEGPGGIQVLWLTPSRANNNGNCLPGLRGAGGDPGVPKIQTVNNCYEEIPASAYFNSSDANILQELQKQAQYLADSNSVNTLNTQITRIQNTINTITQKLSDLPRQLIQSLIGKQFAGIDFATISQDGNFYFYIGSFNSLQGSIDPFQSVVKLQEPTVNICSTPLSFNSPLNSTQMQYGFVQYSVAFWIRIDDLVNNWRNILFHGSSDDWSNNATIDRTPGIWIIPGSASIHFSQRSSADVNPWTNIAYPAQTKNTWYHFAAVVNNNNTMFYINGQNIKTATLGGNDKYIWNQQNKKLYVNNSPPWGAKCTTSVLMNNLVWYNYPISQDEISGLVQKTPYAKSIPELLSTASISGTYTVLYNNTPINLFVYVDPSGTKWVLILLYNHRAGTNPAVKPIKTGNFPIPQNNSLEGYPAGRDESTTPSWGHVAPSYLQNFSISEMAFWATGGSKNKTINFRTTDPSVIKYSATGRDHFNANFTTTTGTMFNVAQNSTIPGNSPNYFADQGDIALTNFPYWRGGQAHWGIGGLGNRWEVDDYSNGPNYNTLHMVFIR
jgi:hypothetical protein